jgi:hypothetical protein
MDFKKFAGIVGGSILTGGFLLVFREKLKNDKKKRKLNARQSRSSPQIHPTTQPSQMDSSPSNPARSVSKASHSESMDNCNDYDFYFDLDNHPSPNDQRSNVMNPNNAAYYDNLDNRANQLNPNNSTYRSSRGKK